MSRIITQEDLRKSSLWNVKKIDSSLWTCVIPAAGKGTRLGCEFPKILYPILGQSILQHLVNIFRKYCNHFVVVASPDGHDWPDKRVHPCGRDHPLGTNADGFLPQPHGFHAGPQGSRLPRCFPRTWARALPCRAYSTKRRVPIHLGKVAGPT